MRILTKLIEQTTQFKEIKKVYEGCYEHFLGKCDQVTALDTQLKDLSLDYSAILEHNATLEHINIELKRDILDVNRSYIDLQEYTTTVTTENNMLKEGNAKLQKELDPLRLEVIFLTADLESAERESKEYQARLHKVTTLRDILAVIITCGMLITVSILLGASNVS